MFTGLIQDNFVSLCVVTLTGLILVQIFRYWHRELRLRKTGGIHAPALASNSIQAAVWFLRAGKAVKEGKLLEFWNSLFTKGTPESPDCVEVQVGPAQRFIMTQDPEHIKAVLTTKFADYGKGEEFHRLWTPFLGDSIFTTDGQLWSDSRGLIRPMFMKDRIADLEIFERWTQVFLSKIPASGGTVDLMDLFYRMTLDMTTDFLLGASVDSLNNPQHKFALAFNEVQRIQMILTTLAPFEKLIPRKDYNKAIKTMNEFIVPFIDQTLQLPPTELEKLEKSDKEFTFLHNVARYTRDPKVIRDQIAAVLLAGRDTTAATLSWTFYELSRYPDMFTKVRAEVLDTVGSSRMPTYEDLKNMKYLKHVINETLRLYPAVPYNLRAALTDTTLPGRPGQPDIAVLKDHVVCYSALGMQRHKAFYPPISEKFADPAVYSPERWDNWTPKAWQYIPFNGGPRICVGQNFALTEMAYCMVRILQKYDRLEYRGDWDAQYHEAEIVGRPGRGVPVVLFEASMHQ